jgi:hypothetical protein
MDYLEDFFKQLLACGPEALVGICIIALCYALKALPFFPNRFIPAVCIFLPVLLYPLVCKPGEAPHDIRYPVIRAGMIGLVIGVLSWLLHNRLLKRWVDKFLFPDGGATKMMRKDPDGPVEPPKTD